LYSHAIRNNTVEERTSVAEQFLTHKTMNSTLKWMNDCKMFEHIRSVDTERKAHE